MNKDAEREILNYVFGNRAFTSVDPIEKPDFICRVSPTKSFGVEVTEFFISESDARLRRIATYPNDLLVHRRYLHKDDRTRLRVENVIYRKANSDEEREVAAIITEAHLPSHVVSSIGKVVAAKNSKYSTYASNATPVDLIIHDVDQAASLKSLKEFLFSLCAGDAYEPIRKSQFREIYLVTMQEEDNVCVPLRATAFASELCTFQLIVKSLRSKREKTIGPSQYFELLCHYLANQFSNVQYDLSSDGKFRFIFASIAAGFSKRTQMKLVDISCDTSIEPKPLAVELSNSVDIELQETILSERRQVFCLMPLEFAAHSRKHVDT